MRNDLFFCCRELTFFYPDALQPALSQVSFSLRRGGLTVVCGESGCGKSTLLRHMKKNQSPFGDKSGRLEMEGRPLEQFSERESAVKIGFVGQNPEEQLVTDTVWHELAFGMENLGYAPDEMRKRTAQIAEYFGMGGWFRRSVSELSGGQKQILNLAAVMVLQPELLILDEPVSQLDPISARRFLQTLLQLNQDFGTTIVLAEQQLEEVLPIADQVLLLHQGRLLGAGAVTELPVILQEAQDSIDRELPILDALPVALRTYIQHQRRAGERKLPGEAVPLSVRDGKRWLVQQLAPGNEDLPVSSGEGEGVTAEEEKTFSAVSRLKRKLQRGKERYALQAEGVAYRYAGTAGSRGVLEDFAVRIPMGEIYAMVGGNGSGKTTALKVLAGVYRPQRGRVSAVGRVCYLAQNPQSVFTEITVWEELAEAYENFGEKRKQQTLSVPERKKRVEEMLDWLELSGQREQNPMDLSGGQQQRLALGKLLLLEPEILLLDEPTKGMDAAFKRKLSGYLQELSRGGMTIVLVSHDLEFCARNASHCGMLFDGQLISHGETREFFRESTFYTTAAKRMAEGILPDCILWEDIAEKLQGRQGTC